MLLNKIGLKNFKCFENHTIDLAPLTLFSGLNGMGKSTVIQSLLLLKQSFDEKVLAKGLSLNGDLISIGTGRDLLYERAEEEEINILLGLENKSENEWIFTYNRESNFLSLDDSKKETPLDEISIFTDQFQYLSAERIGPRTSFEKSNFNVVEHKQLGVRGEYVQHYLHVFGDEKVDNEEIIKDSKSLTLLSQVQAWMDCISPGLRIETSDYSDADFIGLQYRFANNKEFTNKFRPTNVGFGITYILPVVVSLLKAKKGDIIVVENPEAHLHPQGQREMGELIAKACSGGVQVIVETHSDHILNGIRLSVRKKYIKNNKIKLHFFDKEDKEGIKVHKIVSPQIKEDGRLDRWPTGFFDEWDKALNEFF
jgi:predicted ATPase